MDRQPESSNDDSGALIARPPASVRQVIESFESPASLPPLPLPLRTSAAESSQRHKSYGRRYRRRRREEEVVQRLRRVYQTKPALAVNLGTIDTVPDSDLIACLKQYAKRVALMLNARNSSSTSSTSTHNNRGSPSPTVTPLTRFVPQTPSVRCSSREQPRYVAAELTMAWIEKANARSASALDTEAVRSMGAFLVSLVRNSDADPLQQQKRSIDVHCLRLAVTRGRQYVQMVFDMVSGEVDSIKRGVRLSAASKSDLAMYTVDLTLRRRRVQRRLRVRKRKRPRLRAPDPEEQAGAGTGARPRKRQRTAGEGVSHGMEKEIKA